MHLPGMYSQLVGRSYMNLTELPISFLSVSPELFHFRTCFLSLPIYFSIPPRFSYVNLEIIAVLLFFFLSCWISKLKCARVFMSCGKFASLYIDCELLLRFDVVERHFCFLFSWIDWCVIGIIKWELIGVCVCVLLLWNSWNLIWTWCKFEYHWKYSN